MKSLLDTTPVCQQTLSSTTFLSVVTFQMRLGSAIWSVQLVHAVLPLLGHHFHFPFHSKSSQPTVNNSVSDLNSIGIFSFATNSLSCVAKISLCPNPAWIGSASYPAWTVRSTIQLMNFPSSLIQRPQMLSRRSPPFDIKSISLKTILNLNFKFLSLQGFPSTWYLQAVQ